MCTRYLFNARLETASVKPTFKEAWQNHRCIVPAACYYEWEHFGVSLTPCPIHNTEVGPLKDNSLPSISVILQPASFAIRAAAA